MENRILLTAAGFSANFGAPLANDFSDLIFNDSLIEDQSALKDLLRDNFDYENIYQIVMQSDQYDLELKRIFNTAIKNAYDTLDNRIISNNTLSQTFYDLFKKLIFPFAKSYGGSGFIFTLNQDLLIERRFWFYPNDSISSITLPIMRSSVFNKPWSDKISEQNKIFLPDHTSFIREKELYERRLERNEIRLSTLNFTVHKNGLKKTAIMRWL